MISPDQPDQKLIPAGDGQLSEPGAAKEEIPSRALIEEQTTQLKKAHEDLLHAHADLLQARQQIQQNGEYLQAVLNHSPAAIGFVKAVFDNPDPLHGDPATDPVIDYRLVAVNEKFARLVGQPGGQLIGQSASRFTEILWQGDMYASFYRIITEDAALYKEREYDEAGQPRWLSLSATKHDGGVVLTGLDITELRHTQRQHEALHQQLEESALRVAQLATLRQQLSNRSDLLRTTSHDLRSNLSVVQGAVHLLTFAESDADRARIMEMLNRNVKELTRLLTELLDIPPVRAGE